MLGLVYGLGYSAESWLFSLPHYEEEIEHQLLCYFMYILSLSNNLERFIFVFFPGKKIEVEKVTWPDHVGN